MAMLIEQIKLYHVQMELKFPFKTSFGTIKDKEFYIIEITDIEGRKGYGETVAFTVPWYTAETFKTTAHIIKDILIPILMKQSIQHPRDVSTLFQTVKGNHMAKAGLEGAVWDLYAKQESKQLAQVLGGKKQQIDVGVSLGIEENTIDLLRRIDNYAADGYKRFKIKIKPGHDIEVLKAVRTSFPDIPLMVDANSAYTLEDTEHLQGFDEFNLLMMEQPLADNDILDHAILKKALQTPICLDESIHSYEDARIAIELDSCEIINIKIGRVGGLSEAKRIHDLCESNKIEVWCGGMLEAGIGRAHNIALSTLSNFTYPGDVSASSRYFDQDIITPEVTVQNGRIQVPSDVGIGYAIDVEALKYYTKDIIKFHI